MYHFVIFYYSVAFFCVCVEGMGPPNDLNNGEDAAAVYTVGPAPEKLLRDLQQQLGRLFTAKPAEKIPLMMGMHIHCLCIKKKIYLSPLGIR